MAEKQIREIVVQDSLYTVDESSPATIDTKKNGDYNFLGIQEDTTVTIIDDLAQPMVTPTGLAPIPSGLSQFIYWNNSDDTSKLILKDQLGNTIFVNGVSDLTKTNIISLCRLPIEGSVLSDVLYASSVALDTKNTIVHPIVFNSITVSATNDYVDVVFNTGAYGAANTAVVLADISVVFSQNTGTATAWTPSSATQNDNDIEGSATALVGGERTIRIWGVVTGISTGAESIAITPATGNSIYNAEELPMIVSESISIALTPVGIDRTPLTMTNITNLTVVDELYSATSAAWDSCRAISYETFTDDFIVELSIKEDSNLSVMIGLDTSDAHIAYRDYAFLIYVVYTGMINYTTDGDMVRSTGITITTDSSYRIAFRCIAGNLFMSTSDDAGLTYSNIHDFGAYSGAHHVHISGNNNAGIWGNINEPRYTQS